MQEASVSLHRALKLTAPSSLVSVRRPPSWSRWSADAGARGLLLPAVVARNAHQFGIRARRCPGRRPATESIRKDSTRQARSRRMIKALPPIRVLHARAALTGGLVKQRSEWVTRRRGRAARGASPRRAGRRPEASPGPTGGWRHHPRARQAILLTRSHATQSVRLGPPTQSPTSADDGPALRTTVSPAMRTTALRVVCPNRQHARSALTHST